MSSLQGRVVWTGMKELNAILESASGGAGRALASALHVEGEQIMTESKRIAPVDTGRLRSSGHVKPPERRGSDITVELSYATDYALYVHEGTRRMKGRKYLSKPLRAAQNGLDARLAARVRGRVF